jgi:hypothetical protein
MLLALSEEFTENVSVACLPQGNGAKDLSAKDMLLNLERSVRRTLSQKQKEYDATMFALRQAKQEVEKLRLDLRDVKIDKEALGMPEDGQGDADRLVVVKTVFTRPFHTKDEVSVCELMPSGLCS